MKFQSTLFGHQGSNATYPILVDKTTLKHLQEEHSYPHHRRTKDCYAERRTYDDCCEDHMCLTGTYIK